MRHGRPTRRDEETTRAILQAIRSGASRAEAARAGGIARSTLMDWLAKGRRDVGGCSAFLASVLAAERDSACRWRLPTFEKRWAAKRRGETPPWAQLSTDPGARARLLARKRAGRPRSEEGGPEKRQNQTSGTAPAGPEQDPPGQLQPWRARGCGGGRVRDSPDRVEEAASDVPQPNALEMSGMSDEKKRAGVS